VKSAPADLTPDSEEPLVLRHGFGRIGCLAVLCGIVIIGIFLISLAAPPWGDRGQTIGFSVCLGIFFLPIVIGLLEIKFVRVTIADQVITAEMPWPWSRRKTVRWDEIVKVSYSISESFVFKDSRGTRLPISEHFAEIEQVKTLLTERLEPHVYKGIRHLLNTDKKAGA